VRKDAGDDPDVTDGVLVTATVEFSGDDGVSFRAGEGVGTVTKAGLQIPVGEPAINPGPREMITRAVRTVTRRAMTVTLSVPDGEALAEKTFNPRLGVVGGLSILGTTGHVRPYSHEAIQETVRCALSVCASAGHRAPVLVPGNIGARAARRHIEVPEDAIVEVSNEWGVALTHAKELGFEAVLALGHPGKLGKLARGDWDTHSSRSEPATDVAAEAIRQTGRHPGDAPTVDGLFARLSEAARVQAAEVLAGRVREAVEATYALSCAVVLVAMDGAAWAEAGDLGRWPRR
jgi:cobalt-precorrin-5B (C1)-methyltransferase